MALKPQHQSFLPSSRGSIYLSSRPLSIHFSYQEFIDLNRLLWFRGIPRNRCRLRYGTPECQSAICKSQEFKKHQSRYWRSKRTPHSSLLASADENVTVNGASQPTSRSELEGICVKFEQSLEDDDTSSRLVHALHDAARAIELAITEHNSSVNSSWFSKAWIGVDKNGWIKAFSYQAAIYSLLQAAIEISSRGDGRDRDVNVFVQRSLMRQSVPLETMIRDGLSAKKLSVYDWFWSQQYPAVVTTFVNLLERDPQFAAATAICWKGASSGSSRAHDLSLLMLALSCIAAVTKLGPAKVSCTQFFSIVPDVTGRLMDMLVDTVPIWKAYYSVKDIGLRREFLLHFGPRAASCRVKNDQDVEDISFWVELVQKQLQRALDREKIWSRLTTCESIEVLEKDLAIFGFFIALGRSTQSFLSTNGFTEIEKPIESFISYLIGGSALYYPQLSSISSYQLYVEVVCEELEWLPFYQRNLVDHKHSHESKGSENGLPRGEAVSQVLDVCSHWMKSFIKYSAWLENPSNIKAARFLSRGHSMLEECRRDLGIRKNEVNDNTLHENEKCIFETSSPGESELDSFGKALESVEEALSKLEQLLQELHLSNLNHGKEHLKAACSDLERIRKLKKEAEFLEASFRAKAASLEEEVGDGQVPSKRPYTKRKREKNNEFESDGSPIDGTNTKSHGLWSFLAHHSTRRSNSGSITTDDKEGDPIEGTTSCSQSEESAELNEIRRFELLRRELIELEKRVQRSTDGTQAEEELHILDKGEDLLSQNGEHVVPLVQKKENILAKSIDKLKKTSTDVWQGTQLLAIDVAAATVLLKRGLTGDELSEKEKKALRRTLTDLASVVPIGFLMLLPVTAVGHAAMLAAIQRYAPGLIPSTYAPDRLDLLRQLEKVKEIETVEGSSEENVEAKFLS